MAFRMVAAFVGLVAIVQSGGTSRGPRWTVLSAQICVERPGDNGSLNIWPADVVIEDGPTLRLAGEAAACAFVRPGKYNIWVESKNPYDRQSPNPATWKSDVLAVTLTSKDRLEFEVCGAGRDSYSTWKIQPPNSKVPCVPKR